LECSKVEERGFCRIEDVHITKATNINSNSFQNTRMNDIQKIQFIDSTIYEIPIKVFTYFTNINEISAEDCHLNQIGSYIFGIPNHEKLQRLTTINLSHNNISTVDAMAFAGATQLVILKLAYNSIVVLDEKAFTGLKKLQILVLSHNQISTLQVNLFIELEKMEYIFLDYNRLSNINLQMFTSNNNLTNILLNDNEIKTIEDYLVSPRSKIRPRNFNLDYIGLSNNLLIDFNFGLFSVKRCRIRNNLLQKVFIVASAENLDVSFNNIYMVTVTESTALQVLYINNNNVGDISFLSKLNQLEYLDLSFNPEVQIELSSFASMPSLKILGLNSINLSSSRLEFGLFSHLNQLTTLELASNHMKTIDISVFFGMTALQTLYLNDNRLKELNTDDLRNNFPNLSTIRIFNNNWDCRYVRSIMLVLGQMQVTIETPEEFIIKHTTNSKGIGCVGEKRSNDSDSTQIIADVTKNDTNNLNQTVLQPILTEIIASVNKIQKSLDENKAVLKNEQPTEIPNIHGLMIMNGILITIFLLTVVYVGVSKIGKQLKLYNFRNHYNPQTPHHSVNPVFENEI
jgi:Leucine-rich repeat (LRR) protein